MGEQPYQPPFGRINSNHQQDYTPQSAVSSFNLPVIYDSSLNTPVNGTAESPLRRQSSYSSSQDSWVTHQQMSYSRSFHPNAASSIKGKDMALSLPGSESDLGGVTISNFVWDSPQSNPPSPFYGIFGVSGPPELSPASTTPNTNASPRLNTPVSSTYASAPILSAPSPAQLGRHVKSAMSSMAATVAGRSDNTSSKDGQAHHKPATLISGSFQLGRQSPQVPAFHQNPPTLPSQSVQPKHQGQHQERTPFPLMEPPSDNLKHDRHRPVITTTFDNYTPSGNHVLPVPIKRESQEQRNKRIKRRKSSVNSSAPSDRMIFSASSDNMSSLPSATTTDRTSASSSAYLERGSGIFPPSSAISFGGTPVSSTPYQPTDEELILFRLREDAEGAPGHSWKDTQTLFFQETGQHVRTETLQMRYFRGKERMRKWSERETRALVQAMQNHKKTMWNSIALDMLNFGCTDKWSPRACQVRWAELHPEDRDDYLMSEEAYSGTDAQGEADAEGDDDDLLIAGKVDRKDNAFPSGFMKFKRESDGHFRKLSISGDSDGGKRKRE